MHWVAILCIVHSFYVCTFLLRLSYASAELSDVLQSWRRSSSRLRGAATDDLDSISERGHSMSINVEPGDGFFVEYVMQVSQVFS